MRSDIIAAQAIRGTPPELDNTPPCTGDPERPGLRCSLSPRGRSPPPLVRRGVGVRNGSAEHVSCSIPRSPRGGSRPEGLGRGPPNVPKREGGSGRGDEVPP